MTPQQRAAFDRIKEQFPEIWKMALSVAKGSEPYARDLLIAIVNEARRHPPPPSETGIGKEQKR